VRLEGSPIALTAVASSSAEWLKVEQVGATIRVRAEAGPGVRAASVILSGPTGEWTIPVHDARPDVVDHPTMPMSEPALTMPDTESEPPPPPPEPEPDPPQPAPKPEPPHVEPASVLTKHVEPPGEKATSAPPWWLIAVLLVGSAVLIYLNWPGEEYSRKLWYEENSTGWYVYRSWGDPMILASFVALVATLVSRWAGPITLGIVAGCAASVIEDGLLVLGGGISYIETTYWLGATAVAVVMAVVLLVVLWPGSWPMRPVPRPGAVMVVAGGILLLVHPFVQHSEDGMAFFDVTWLAVVEPFVTVAIAWLALAATESRARIWLTAAAATYGVISIVSAVPALTEGDSPPAFLTALLGNGLIVAGVLSRGSRLRSRP
jgi:hypothetical protein